MDLCFYMHLSGIASNSRFGFHLSHNGVAVTDYGNDPVLLLHSAISRLSHKFNRELSVSEVVYMVLGRYASEERISKVPTIRNLLSWMIDYDEDDGESDSDAGLLLVGYINIIKEIGHDWPELDIIKNSAMTSINETSTPKTVDKRSSEMSFVSGNPKSPLSGPRTDLDFETIDGGDEGTFKIIARTLEDSEDVGIIQMTDWVILKLEADGTRREQSTTATELLRKACEIADKANAPVICAVEGLDKKFVRFVQRFGFMDSVRGVMERHPGSSLPYSVLE